MELNIISKDLGILAKKAGFNQKVSCCYNISTDTTRELTYESCWNTEEDLVALPTQELLRKWFRQKHNIFIESTFGDYGENTIGYRGFILNLDSPMNFLFSDTLLYVHYENCLEVTLKEAFKFIK